MRLLLFLAALLAATGAARAGCPGTSGDCPVGTFSGLVIGPGAIHAAVSSTTAAPFNIPPGSAPTSPSNGDMWTTSSGFFIRSGGVTVGPLGTGSNVTWPGLHDVIVSSTTDSPLGIHINNGECLVGTTTDPASGACGGAAFIAIQDSAGNTVNSVATVQFGPGLIVAPNGSGVGTVNLNPTVRAVATCSGSPSPCLITQNDASGQVTYTGASLTATIPAITAASFTGALTAGTLTTSSVTGTISIGQALLGAGVPDGTIIYAGSGSSWSACVLVNNACASTASVSSEAMTSIFGASGATVRLLNTNAANLTLASATTIVGYPGGATGTVPFDGGIDIASTGAIWNGVGLGFQPGQAFTNRDQTWNPSNTQTWGLSKVPRNAQTGTAYTLSASDCGIPLDIANGSPVTVTVPGTYPLDCFTPITQTGAGQITVVTSTGATIDGPGGITKTRVQWSTISVMANTNAGGTTAHVIVGGDGA